MASIIPFARYANPSESTPISVSRALYASPFPRLLRVSVRSRSHSATLFLSLPRERVLLPPPIPFAPFPYPHRTSSERLLRDLRLGKIKDPALS